MTSKVYRSEKELKKFSANLSLACVTQDYCPPPEGYLHPGKVQLETDFIDYYDHMFDSVGRKFRRMSRTHMTRSAAFRRMQELGLDVPLYGTVSRMWDMLTDCDRQVVVYTDELAHRGECKELMFLKEACIKYQDEDPLCALFIDTASEQPFSVRYLRIGPHVFWLCFSSDDEWRSNCGSDVSVTFVADQGIAIDENTYHPLLAIDFIPSTGGVWYAVDYNTSPGLRHTPIEDELTAQEVVDAIKIWSKHTDNIMVAVQ